MAYNVPENLVRLLWVERVAPVLAERDPLLTKLHARKVPARRDMGGMVVKYWHHVFAAEHDTQCCFGLQLLYIQQYALGYIPSQTSAENTLPTLKPLYLSLHSRSCRRHRFAQHRSVYTVVFQHDADVDARYHVVRLLKLLLQLEEEMFANFPGLHNLCCVPGPRVSFFLGVLDPAG